MNRHATPITALEEQFSDNPMNIDLLCQLAESYLENGQFNTKALDVYRKAAITAPARDDFRQAAQAAMLLKHLRRFTVDFSDAAAISVDGLCALLPTIHDLLNQYPKSPELFLALGDIHLLKGNVLPAIGAYENAIKSGLMDLRPIIHTYEIATKSHTFPPSERTYFARLYHRLGLHDEALQLYREVVAHGFFDPATLHALIQILQTSCDLETNQNAANNLRMEIVELYLLEGNRKQALEEFEKVQFPINQNFALVKRIASILIEMEDYRQAFDYLSKIPVDEENKALLNQIAAELEKIGELDTAVYLLKFINDNDLVIREARAMQEREMEVHTELAVADLHYSNRRYDKALSHYTRVLQLGYKDDIGLLNRIIETLPLLRGDNLGEFHAIGQHFLDKQDWYRAMQFYQMALDRRPDDAESQAKLRLIYDNILERNPNLPELRLRSGDLYLDEDKLENAIGEYKHAAQFPETNVEATRRLAIAYMKKQNFTLAVEAFQSIPTIDLDIENLYELQLIMMKRNRLPEALNLLNTIYSLDENYRDTRERLDTLRAQINRHASTVASDPKMHDLIGDLAIGRYKYMEKIGSGGMGVVHKVFDQKLNRPVAMKILREGLANSGKAIERFFREARIAATLNHRNIVNIFDYNINQQTHCSFISMEYVDGTNVREIFEQYQNNPNYPFEERVKEALFYLSQLCDALSMTHSKGIIHRDIKPDNILISTDHIAKITDFGIVHIEEASFTPTGAVIGTPRYMSPEQVQGIRLDGRADLYSTGIILYEWLLGMPPFISGDIAYQQVNMPPTPPIDQNPDIPPQVNRIALKCLEKNPADRYQRAADLKTDLDAALHELAPGGMKHLVAQTDSDVDTF